MIVVHHLNNSRSQRVLWALEELELPYEIKRYERDIKTNLAPESIKKIHPLGKFPVITDGDITIAESGAIIEYLCQAYGKGQFIPQSNTEEYRQYIYWLHFAEGSLMPQLLFSVILNKIKNNASPFFVKPIANAIVQKVMSGYVGPNITTNLNFIEEHLKNNNWFAGEQLSGADIQMSFPLEAWASKNSTNQQYPNVFAYVKRFQARPAYQKALKTGGRYDYVQ